MHMMYFEIFYITAFYFRGVNICKMSSNGRMHAYYSLEALSEEEEDDKWDVIDRVTSYVI